VRRRDLRRDPGLEDAGIDGTEIDAFVDSDGDGVPDAIDNCRNMPNPDQGDEDHDGLGDDCDPCPIDTDNTDSDGDGVPGLCDPHPTIAGDKKVLFKSFHRGIPSTWRVVGTGTITATGGDAVFTNTANQTAALVAPVTTPFGNGMIMASVIVARRPAAATCAPR
jgi:hypothetical protein